MVSPSKRVTGRIPATELDRNASSASCEVAGREQALGRPEADVRAPSAGSSRGSCPGRIAQARRRRRELAHPRTRNRLAEVASDR